MKGTTFGLFLIMLLGVQTSLAQDQKGEQQGILGTFTDSRDGKTYKMVNIGNQIWMAENLNYDVGIGSYCYGNDPANCSKYGRLYTLEAAKRAVPRGWHLPSKSEFDQLLSYLGGSGNPAYQNLIEGGSSQFNVLFGGSYHKDYGEYGTLGSHASFWSSSVNSFIGDFFTGKAINLSVNRFTGEARLYGSLKTYAFSVRCLKDGSHE